MADEIACELCGTPDSEWRMKRLAVPVCFGCRRQGERFWNSNFIDDEGLRCRVRQMEEITGLLWKESHAPRCQ